MAEIGSLIVKFDKSDIEDYAWLKWFCENADFGPSHDDVMIKLQERYKQETGNDVPLGWVYEYQDGKEE